MVGLRWKGRTVWFKPHQKGTLLHAIEALIEHRIEFTVVFSREE